MKLNETDYIIPSSDEPVALFIFLGKSVELSSFSIDFKETEMSIISESGLFSAAESPDIESGRKLLFVKNGEFTLKQNSPDRPENIGLQFFSENNSPEENISVGLDDATEYSIRTREGLNSYWFYEKDFSGSLGEIRFQIENAELNRISTNQHFSSEEAIYTDLEEFIYWDKKSWRQEEYELFRWNDFPQILLIDTASYSVQSSFFKRLAFFTEKKISVGELMNDEDLKTLHGWNAHDYKAPDLARFFNEALKLDFPLNNYELLLKELLLENDILKITGERVRPGKGGILSISRESDERLRWLFLTHECYHGLFFSSDEYVNLVTEIWKNLSEEERDFWRIFLDMYGYNVHDEYLLINEFQAYLMQQDTSLSDSYFRSKINWILSRKPQLRIQMNSLLDSYGDTFTKSAESVENAAYSLTGIRAGDLVLKKKK